MIRADTTRSCAGCQEIRDEPWAGERETAHRCMAEGPQQGRVVGFDKAWNNLVPAWCPKRADGGGLRTPEIYGSRGAVHPGAAEASKEVTRAAANVRWRALKEELGAKIGPSQSPRAATGNKEGGMRDGDG